MRNLRDYEDWILFIATLLAAISEALQLEPRYTLWALIVGALAKALMSLISGNSGSSPWR